jgi:hypothetical protein
MFYPVVWVCGDGDRDWHFGMGLNRLQRGFLAVATFLSMVWRISFGWICMSMWFGYVKILGIAMFAVMIVLENGSVSQTRQSSLEIVDPSRPLFIPPL